MAEFPLFLVDLSGRLHDRVGGAGIALIAAVVVVTLLKALASQGETRASRLGATSWVTLLGAALGFLLLAPLAQRQIGGEMVLASLTWTIAGGAACGPLLAFLSIASPCDPARARRDRQAAVLMVALLAAGSGVLRVASDSVDGLEGFVIGAARDARVAREEEAGPTEADEVATTEPASSQTVLASHEAPISEPEPVAQQATLSALPADKPEEPNLPEPDFLFPQYNFSYTKPSTAWLPTEIAPELAVADVRLMMRRLWPAMTCAVKATKLSVSLEDHDLVTIVVQQMESLTPGMQVGPATRQSVDGINGLLFACSGAEGGVPIATKTWVGQHAGIAYQLSVVGPAASQSQVSGQLFDLLKGFKLLDRNTAHAGAVAGGPKHPPHDFAYRYLRDDPDWIETSEDEEVTLLNYFGVNVRTGTFAGVASLPLGDEPVDPDTLAEVFLAAFQFTPDDVSLSQSNRYGIELPHADHVVDYNARRAVGGQEIEYAMRLVTTSGCAHLVVGWAPTDKYGAAQSLQTVLKRFELTGEPPAHEPPSDPKLRLGLAETLNELAFAEFRQGRLRAARARLEQAVRYDPSTPVFTENLIDVIVESEGAKAALAWLDSADRSDLDPTQLARFRAELLTGSERFDEALDAYAQVAVAGPLDDDALHEMGNLAVVTERFDEVLAAYDRAIQDRRSPELERWRATLLGRAGRHDDAIRELTELQQRDPDDAAVSFVLAEAYEEAERYEEGAQICEACIEKHPNYPEFLSLLGRLRMQSEDYEGAQEAFERCLKANPGDEESTALLKHVTALLGRGDNRLIRESIEPVPLPSAIAQELAATPALERTAEIDSHGAYIAYQAIGYDYRVGSRRRVTERRRVRVINRYGAEQSAVMTLSFNPLNERFFVNELVVRDEQGAEIARGELADYYVLDESSDGLDTYDQVVKIPVPGVRPGCTVDLIATRESLSSRSDFGFETQFLTGTSPSAKRVVYVSGDIDAIAHQAFDVEPRRPDAETLAWVAKSPPAVVAESYQRDLEEYLPVVHLSDAGRSWRQLASEYLEDLAPTLEPDAEVEALAERLCAGAATPAEKIEAIARHVQKEITYHGLEFGVRGVIPHQVGQVCRTGKGDCKDHSLLLVHLLRAVGVRAHLALVNSSGPVAADLPSLDQFDHMVVVAPDMPLRGGGVAPHGVLDATEKWFDPMLGLPPALSQKRLLVMDPAGPHLVKTGPVDPSLGWIECRRNAQVVERDDTFGSASLSVAETVTFGAHLSALLRHSFDGATDEQRRGMLRRMISDNRSVRVTEVALSGVEEVHEPLVVRCRYLVEDAFHEVATSEPLLVGTIPNHWATLYCAPEPVDQRKTPFEFATPVTFQSTTRLTPPAESRVRLATSGTLGENSPAFSWRATATPAGGNAIDLSMTIRRPSGVYAADAYQAFSESANRALRVSCKAVTIAGQTQAVR